MSATDCILAIDLGTSGCKTALVTLQGEVLGWEFEPIDTLLLPGGGAEQRPEDWWQALCATTGRLMARGLVAPEAVVALCSSTQGEGTVPVDAEGKALCNAILWMDMRGAEHVQRHVHGWINFAGYDVFKLARWVRLTGGAPSLTGKDPAGHMLYVRDSMPEIYARTHKFLNVLDYMNLRLTGRFVGSFDSITTSWVTDNRDARNVTYDDTLVRYSGIAREKFPDLLPCTGIVGNLTPAAAQALGLTPRVQVVAGAIDTGAAAIGSGAVRDYETHLYLGTSSWMAAHMPNKKTDIIASMASLPCARPERYLLTALQATAGGNLTFLRDKILYHKDELLQEASLPDVYKIMDRIAAATPAGSNGVIYTPWIYGERSPVDNPTIRAGIHNLSLENSRADIIRAFLEGVAYNTRWLLQPFEKNLGQPIPALHLVGGGAASDIWCQIFADVLDRPVRQVADPIQCNVLGAAFIGAVGLGAMTFDEVPARVRFKREYLPTKAHRDVYDTAFAAFTAIYQANKKIHHRLNRGRGAHTPPQG